MGFEGQAKSSCMKIENEQNNKKIYTENVNK